MDVQLNTLSVSVLRRWWAASWTRVWTGLIWLRFGANEGLLWTR